MPDLNSALVCIVSFLKYFILAALNFAEPGNAYNSKKERD